MIAVPEKYTLEVSSPTPITSERQHELYLSVLDKKAGKDNPTSEEEKYAEVLLTLIEAHEQVRRPNLARQTELRFSMPGAASKRDTRRPPVPRHPPPC